jgi:hypothetical protein
VKLYAYTRRRGRRRQGQERLHDDDHCILPFGNFALNELLKKPMRRGIAGGFFLLLSLSPLRRMSSSSFWSDACTNARYKTPLQTLQSAAYAGCSVTVRLARAAAAAFSLSGHARLHRLWLIA